MAVDELGDTSSMDTFSLTVNCSLYSGSGECSPSFSVRLLGRTLVVEELREEAQVWVYRADGRLGLARTLSGSGRVELFLGLPSGVYWVKLRAGREERTLRAVLR